jgi:hypothetical protein
MQDALMNDGTLILRLQGTEVTINSTANTISGGSFVRVLNKDGGYVTLTHQRVAANLANVSITLAPGQTCCSTRRRRTR